MKNRHWWSPQGEGTDRDAGRLERCDDVAHLLTALFDGEANEEDTRRARLHLLACQRCAELLAHWTQTRQLLRTEAVPAPPPTLLWRVLLACRIAALAGRPAKTPPKKAPPVAQTQDVLSPAPPSRLKDSILANTVGTAPRRAPEVPRWRRNPGAWTALAAPALGLWLMAIVWRQGPAELAPAPVLNSNLPIIMPAPGAAASHGTEHDVVRAAARVLVKKVAAPARREITLVRAPVHDFVAAATGEKNAHPTTAGHAEGSPSPVELEVRRSERAIERREHAEEARIRLETRHEQALAEADNAPATHSPSVVLASATVPMSARPSLATSPVQRPLLRLASLADHDVDVPRPRRTSFRPLAKIAIAKLARAAGTMRASTPVEPVSTPLVIASAGDPDHGLDEVQSTVEDLRALFATDSNSDGGSDIPS